MDFSRAQVDPRRNVLGVGFVVLFHAALVYALMSGLARKVVDVVRAPIDTKVIEEIVKPPPPPEVAVQPPPKLDAPPPPFIPPPEVQVPAPAQPSITATVAEPPPSAVIAPVAPVAAPPAPAPAAPSVGVSCPGYRQVLLDAGYPREATRAQIDQGEVLVSFTIGADGQVKNAAIVRSTHRAFNRHSLETVAQFRCTAQPHDVAGVLVPLVFSTR
ncbi:MAG TPA: TonB family protein [Rhizobacter sp.]|nr:TonB family protein [Rhizobacter sp.]